MLSTLSATRSKLFLAGIVRIHNRVKSDDRFVNNLKVKQKILEFYSNLFGKVAELSVAIA